MTTCDVHATERLLDRCQRWAHPGRGVARAERVDPHVAVVAVGRGDRAVEVDVGGLMTSFGHEKAEVRTICTRQDDMRTRAETGAGARGGGKGKGGTLVLG